MRCVSREVEPLNEARPPTDLERRRSGLALRLSAADFANLSQLVLLKVLPGRSVKRFCLCRERERECLHVRDCGEQQLVGFSFFPSPPVSPLLHASPFPVAGSYLIDAAVETRLVVHHAVLEVERPLR